MPIRLHPKHGLNPTVSTCFWCGATKNELVLLGAAYKEEAPMHMITSYEPCDECTKNFDKGITLIEVSTSSKFTEHPPIQKNPNLYPTGRIMVVRAEAAPRIFNAHVEAVLEKRKAFIDETGYSKLIEMLQPHAHATSSQTPTPDSFPPEGDSCEKITGR